jgi:DNA-directed RNA polymerase subunit N (RpoN/RPB10)
MRKVNFRMNELLKYETIKELVDYNGNKNRAVQNLGISRRPVDRLIIIYKEKENLVLSTETEDISPKKH